MSKKSVLIIAEAGVNHNGDLKTAKKLIDVAADAGADLVKFQTFKADRLATRQAKKAKYQSDATCDSQDQYEMLSSLELTEKKHHELIKHCDRRSIGFFSTAFDIESVDFLASLGMDYFKIPSGEITNLPLLRHIGRFKKQIILSTGMSTLGDIEAAIDVIEQAGTERSTITALHCTTEYPAPISEVNLRAMKSIKSALGVSVGYSDHTLGIEVAIAAVAMGAEVIEKHFTLDKDMPGPDHKASLDPNELKCMVQAIRNIELAVGDGVKRISMSEAKNIEMSRKSIVARKPIKVGDTFTIENITTKRPGTGISPMSWDTVLGSKSTRNFSIDEMIEL